MCIEFKPPSVFYFKIATMLTCDIHMVLLYWTWQVHNNASKPLFKNIRQHANTQYLLHLRRTPISSRLQANLHSARYIKCCVPQRAVDVQSPTSVNVWRAHVLPTLCRRDRKVTCLLPFQPRCLAHSTKGVYLSGQYTTKQANKLIINTD